MRYRTLDVRLWGDKKFRALSPLQPSGQALFLYLLTNPNTTLLPGLYRAGAAGMAEELGWTREAFQEALHEVLEQGLVMADLEARVIFIPNVIRYNKPQSPNVIKGWPIHWDEIPECTLKNEAYQHIKAFVNNMSEGFVKAFAETFCEAMPNQEQEQYQEQYQEQNQNQELISSLQEDMTLGVASNNETVGQCPHEVIISLYHELLPMCPRVRMWHKERARFLLSRWREKKEHQSIEWWRGYFEYVKQSAFLIGNVPNSDGKPPFIADLEWLIRPGNFAKVIEGKYHGGVL